MKIIDSIWFTQMNEPQTLGIVIIDTGFEKKAYIGSGFGHSEEQDAKMIAERGAKLSKETLYRILAELDDGNSSRF